MRVYHGVTMPSRLTVAVAGLLEAGLKPSKRSPSRAGLSRFCRHIGTGIGFGTPNVTELAQLHPGSLMGAMGKESTLSRLAEERTPSGLSMINKFAINCHPVALVESGFWWG